MQYRPDEGLHIYAKLQELVGLKIKPGTQLWIKGASDTTVFMRPYNKYGVCMVFQSDSKMVQVRLASHGATVSFEIVAAGWSDRVISFPCDEYVTRIHNVVSLVVERLVSISGDEHKLPDRYRGQVDGQTFTISERISETMTLALVVQHARGTAWAERAQLRLEALENIGPPGQDRLARVAKMITAGNSTQQQIFEAFFVD